MIYTLVKDPMYGRCIVFVADCTEEKFTAWLNTNHDVEIDITGALGKTVLFEDEEQNSVYVIWVEDSTQIQIVAHEVFHLAVKVMGHIGMTLAEESEEAYAWYFESVFYNIISFIGRKGKQHGRSRKPKRKHSSRSTKAS